MIGQIGQGGGGGGGGDTDGHYGSGGGGGGDTAGGADWMQEEVQVPTSVIGFIIGRGGENISRMQIRTGAKIQIQQNNPSELQPGQTHRTISLSGKADAIAQVKEWIDKVVLEKSGCGGSGGAGTGGGAGSTNQRAPGGPGIGFSSGGNSAEDKNYARIQEAIAAGHVHLQVQVPDVDVGLVIGRQGATIKSLQERTGANIQVPPAGSAGTAEANPGMRIVNITHPSAEGAQAAKALIENMLAERQQQKATAAGAASLDTSSHMAAAAGQPVAAITAPAATSVQILIPDKDVGLCIGRQGCVIRQMQATSQTRIQIPQHCTPAPNDPYNQQPPTRVATIIGSPEGCAMVQQMIGRIIAEQSSAGVMGHSTQQQHGGGGWQQHHQSSYPQQAQQQLQPSQGQQGYSAEWAAYHAAQQQAATQQQQQQQQQQEQAAAVAQQQSIATAATAPTATATTATATGQPAADAYYEEFFRYAYYYGEPAARKHYGAWAPPEGTPNPYGANPNGVQPAPAAATTTAAATVSPTAPAAAVSAATVPQTVAAASVPVSDARETSRRKVSNLPAWMTKS
jgi:far upstream element-binding protein